MAKIQVVGCRPHSLTSIQNCREVLVFNFLALKYSFSTSKIVHHIMVQFICFIKEISGNKLLRMEFFFKLSSRLI